MASDGEAFIATAGALAREIAASAVWFDGRCAWTGALAGDESRPIGSRRIHAALGPELYDGTAGVALFLAEAAVRLDDDGLRRTALGALRHALAHAGRIPPETRDGLYGGQIGIAYAAARIAGLLASEEALDGARRLLHAWRRAGADPWRSTSSAAAQAPRRAWWRSRSRSASRGSSRRRHGWARR